MTNTITDEQAMREIAMEQRDLRGPEWRWDLAAETLNDRQGLRLRRFGRDFCDVHHYRMLCEHSPVGRKQAFHLHPTIVAAERLNTDTVKTGHLKVAVLGELDPKEVCRQLNIDEAVFCAWEKTFFDARGCRSATGWIQIHVIQPEIAAGRGELAARLRMVSAVGPVAAQVILKADTRLPIREAQKLFERKLKLQLKFDAAVELTTDTDKSRMFFIGQHAKLLFEEKRLQHAREKLEKKCAEALNRHELAKIYAEIALEREQNRAAARARCDEGVALAKVGEQQSHELLVKRQREKEMAEQAALAARIAASPLGRLQWRHREEFDDKVSVQPEPPPHTGQPRVAMPASAPLALMMSSSMGMALVGVPA